MSVAEILRERIVMNADNRKIVAALPTGVGVDATEFDGSQAFASCRDGKLEVVSETAPRKFEIVQTVATPEGARTITVNSETHVAYLPTGELEPAKPDSRPRAKPGPCMIVVGGRTNRIRHLLLTGRRCLVVGGGKTAEEKIPTLLACGAAVVVVVPAATPKIQAQAHDEKLFWVQKRFAPNDLDGIFMIVVPTSSKAVNSETLPQLVMRSSAMSRNACGYSLPGPAHHSDRGIQYASGEYVATLKKHEIVPSMSRPANPHDNWRQAYAGITLLSRRPEGTARTCRRMPAFCHTGDRKWRTLNTSPETEQGSPRADLLLRHGFARTLRSIREACLLYHSRASHCGVPGG